MGLDMYLYLRKYESVHPLLDQNARYFYPSELRKIEDRALSVGDTLSKYTEYRVGYWRKANAIHKWFVDHCADGVDKCQDIYVSAEQLKMLLYLCGETLRNKENASKLLPTASGFFFGSQEYDDYYFQDIRDTVKIFENVIEVMETNPDYKCIYKASW